MKGGNTIGYGGSKKAVIQAAKDGLTLQQTAKKYGITVQAARCAAIRNNVILVSEHGRPKYGSVKNALTEGHSKGLTIKQIAEEYKVKITSLKRLCYDLQIKIPNA